MKEIKIFSPATIANVSCGFDVLGCALDTIGDEMVIRKSDKKGIQILSIKGQDLPLDTAKNVAGVAAMALLREFDKSVGFEIEIIKRIKPGSGIGSSAASSAGAVWAINELLNRPFSKTDLVRFAMQGEKLASGVAHADNVAPGIFGGFTLIRSYEPLDIVSINTPENLFAAVIHPQIEVKTSDAREILQTKVPLKEAIRQWGNVGGLVLGLQTNNYDLISNSLQDFIVEPIRSLLIPAFDKVKKTAIDAGALGCGISGSGPSIFAFTEGAHAAQNVIDAMRSTYKEVGIPFEIHLSKINETGIKIIE